MTWWCGARKNTQLYSYSYSSWRLTSSTAGLGNDAVNKDKSSTTLFTLSPKQKAGTITLGGTPSEGGWGNNIPWCHIWQQADLETAYCQGRIKSQTQAGYSSQTCWYHLGCKRENTEGSVPGNSQTTSWIWLHSIVNHSKDQPTNPWQGPEPGTSADNWGDEVHIDHRNGEAHWNPTSRSKEGRQDYDTGRQVQVHTKPSHENQAGGSHQ